MSDPSRRATGAQRPRHAQPQTPTPHPTPGPTPAQLTAAAATSDLLSVPVRLHLVWLLAHHDHDVSTLAELVGAQVAAVSHHLARLRLAGVITAH